MSELYVYMGTYTSGNNEGIYVFRFNPEKVGLEPASDPARIINPSYLCISENRKYLYSVCETDEFEGQPTGAVAAFKIDPASGKLDLLNYEAVGGGRSPCHLSVDKQNRFLFAASYSSGTVTQLKIKADGSLGEVGPVIQHTGSGPITDRQEKAHAHFVSLTPDEKYLCAVDLGTDSIMLYDYNPVEGMSAVPNANSLKLRPGSGPRHLEFSPNGSFMYVITELSNEIVVFAYDGKKESFNEIQTISTLPAGYEGISYCSAIHASPDGRFLYGSNRGHDSISAFKADISSGMLSLPDCIPTKGEFPRDFAIDPSGSLLLAANQNSNSVFLFKRGRVSGLLEPAGDRLDIPSPVCIKFLEL